MDGGAEPGRTAFDFVDEIENMTDKKSVIDRFDCELKKFGLHAWLITGLPNPGDRIDSLIMLNGWPDGWTDLYTRLNLIQHDPIAAHCFLSTAPFDWREVHQDAYTHPKARQVMEFASDFRMMHGFCVPIHTSGGFQAVVTMAGDIVHLDKRDKRALHLMSLYAYDKAVELCAPTKRPRAALLTKREREVLQWSAVGKTAWEISQILHISEQTVVSHIKSAAEKFDTPNRIATVVAALRRREISL